MLWCSGFIEDLKMSCGFGGFDSCCSGRVGMVARVVVFVVVGTLFLLWLGLF